MEIDPAEFEYGYENCLVASQNDDHTLERMHRISGPGGTQTVAAWFLTYLDNFRDDYAFTQFIEKVSIQILIISLIS